MLRRVFCLFLASVFTTPAIATTIGQDDSPMILQSPKIWDVIVIGSGLAGISASLSALEAGGKNVLLIEKTPLIGGHSLFSSGSLAAVSPKRQKPQGIEDSIDLLWKDSYQVGGEEASEPHIRKIGQDSEAILDWMAEKGIKFNPQIFQSMGGLHPRCIATPGVMAGKTYVLSLFKEAKKLGLQRLLSTKATSIEPIESPATNQPINRWRVLVTHNGNNYLLTSYAVILATGGFTDNARMRESYQGNYGQKIQASTASSLGDRLHGAQGDGILMAAKQGAAIVGMKNIQSMPLSGGRILDYVGADIYINKNGLRFINEDTSWKALEHALYQQPEQMMWVITDAKSHKGIQFGAKLSNGTIRKSDSIEDMALGMDINPSVLKKTLKEYNQAVRKKQDPSFGKKVFTQTIDTPPFYWGKEHLYAHMTLGGVKIDTKARVLDTKGQIIPGLYAVGETTGGIFGKDRLGGMSLMACLVFGKEAGKQSILYTKKIQTRNNKEKP